MITSMRSRENQYKTYFIEKVRKQKLFKHRDLDFTQRISVVSQPSTKKYIEWLETN